MKSKMLRASFFLAVARALTIATSACAAEEPTAKEENFFVENRIKPLSEKRLEALFTNHSVTIKNLHSGKTSVSFYESIVDSFPDYIHRADGNSTVWAINKSVVTESDEKDVKGDTDKDYSVYEYKNVLYVCGFSRKSYCGDIIVNSAKGNKL